MLSSTPTSPETLPHAERVHAGMPGIRTTADEQLSPTPGMLGGSAEWPAHDPRPKVETFRSGSHGCHPVSCDELRPTRMGSHLTRNDEDCPLAWGNAARRSARWNCRRTCTDGPALVRKKGTDNGSWTSTTPRPGL